MATIAIVPSVSASAIAEDVFPVSYLSQSAIPGGAACAYNAGGTGPNNNDEVILTSGANVGALAGISKSFGPYNSNGIGQGASTSGTDRVSIQKIGRARALLAANAVVTVGDTAVAANSSGHVKARTPFSFSTGKLGKFAQTKTAGANPELVEVDLELGDVEFVRSITVSQPLKTTVLGAATVFGLTTGTAFATAAVQLYCARFAGETIRNLAVNLGIAPGGADTVAVTVQTSTDGGNTWADRAVTATVSAAGTQAFDLTHTYVLAKGEVVAIKLVSSAGTAAGACVSVDIS